MKQVKHEPEYVVDENAVEVEFKDESKRILFKDYFKLIATTEDGVKAVCKTCKLIQFNSHKRIASFRSHLKVCGNLI